MVARVFVCLIIGMGIAFWLLAQAHADGPFSPLWWIEIILILGLVAGFARGRGLNGQPPYPLVAFAALIWVFGMAYELTLTVDGTGLGGIHPDTAASFILAQGDYLMIAVVTVGAVWYWRLTPTDTLWIAGGKSLTEGLIFTGVLTGVLQDPTQIWYAPLMASYYALAYASFMVLPLFVLAPAALWRAGTGWRPNLLVLWAFGFAAAFLIRVIWGLSYAPLAAALFALPPNTVP